MGIIENSNVPFISVAHQSWARREHVQCVIIRHEASLQNFYYPTYELILESCNRTLIVAKKLRMNRTSNYHLFDMTRGNPGTSLNKKSCNYKIAFVVSNKKSAAGLKIAKKNKILTKIISQQFLKAEQKKLAKIIINKDIRFICLAGFMKILSPYFLNFFKNKIINIHPSLLPKYKGLNTHHRALKAKEKFSGCTIHYVNKKLDSGKIIAQKKVKILKKDNIKKLEKRVLKEENKLYPTVLEKLIMS